MQADLIPPATDLSGAPTSSRYPDAGAPLRERVAEWPTLVLFAATMAVWGSALALPAGWGLVAVGMLVLALTLHSSLSHEILHGHPFRDARVSTALGLIQPGLAVPYLRFKALHLAHHRDETLTDPYDDPETNYLDPAVFSALPAWRQALLRANNTLLGRMVLGPAIGTWAFVAADLAAVRRRERAVALHWALHVPGVVLTLWVVSLSALPIWAYLVACYGALSVLKIRTFLEHRAHETCGGRTVIVEDRGLLALLFLNNNFHVVHHLHPGVAWYDLPRVYAARKARYQTRNAGYVYGSYRDVFRRYLLQTKDPVAHPLWQVRDK